MEDKFLQVISDFTQVLKEVSISNRELSSNQTKQTESFNKSIVKAFIITVIALIITNVITASCLIYNIFQQYQYTGYPETSIENTQIGGNYNGEETKTTKTTKTTATKEEKEMR